MSATSKVGLYGKGTTDVVRARADAKNAAEHAASNFSRTKPYNCIVHPQPRAAKPASETKPQP